MAITEHAAILSEGVEAWNNWRKHNHGIRPDLFGADLSGLDLRGANFDDANIGCANLRNANLAKADLGRADLGGDHHSIRATHGGTDLREANLDSAHLFETSFSGSDLRGASVCGAHMHGTSFVATQLAGADLTDSRLSFTVFNSVDLSEVHGLDAVKHDGPSIIDLDTVFRSKGRISSAFLRGAGVPDDFIDYVRAMSGKAIEFYSCFISYSKNDQDFAERLHADLQARGVRCWFAPHDVRAGRKLHEQIGEAIRLYDRLLLVLSEHSMSSEWVKTEIAYARLKELNEHRQVLFPISLVPFSRIRDWECFDADTGKDSGREIREYFVPDFSAWKDHDSYQGAFQRLVRDLKAEPERASA